MKRFGGAEPEEICLTKPLTNNAERLIRGRINEVIYRHGLANIIFAKKNYFNEIFIIDLN